MIMFKWQEPYHSASNSFLDTLLTSLTSFLKPCLISFLFGKPKSTEMLPIVLLKCSKNPLVSSQTIFNKLSFYLNKSLITLTHLKHAEIILLLLYAESFTLLILLCLIKSLSITLSRWCHSKETKRKSLLPWRLFFS